MSRLIGEGMDAMLVAGGADSPEAQNRMRAVVELLKGYRLYGNPSGRGWSGCAFRALEALCPEAAQCLTEYGPEAAWEKFGEQEDE